MSRCYRRMGKTWSEEEREAIQPDVDERNLPRCQDPSFIYVILKLLTSRFEFSEIPQF